MPQQAVQPCAVGCLQGGAWRCASVSHETPCARSNNCKEKNVKAAYRTLCPQCISDLRVCGKCTMSRDDPQYG